MTARHSPPDLHTASSRAHVLDPMPALATHVFDAAHALADHPTLRYTLAGSPNGEPAEPASATCA